MSDDTPPEIIRAAKLKALWEELSFALYDLEGFMANREAYYELNPDRAANVDGLLHYTYVLLKKDGMVQHLINSGAPLPNITVDRSFK